MSEIDVRPLELADTAAADALILAHPRSSFFHRSRWSRVVERVFRHVPCHLGAWRGEELVGVLPLMESRGLLGGKNLLSVPYGVYGGPVGADEVVEHRLVAAAVRMADVAGVRHLELRYQYDPGPDLLGTQLYWTFLRDLPDDPAEVLKRMPKKARADARKARDTHGLELATGNWYVEDLYRLFVANKHSLGSPAMPPELFRVLIEEFGDELSVHLVRRDREPLAAVMAFHDRETLVAYYSGTAPGADRAFKASNFMYLALQEWAVERGFRVFDFGRSRADAGAFQFKKHQGFEPQPLFYRYHLVRDRRLPSFNPSNPKTAVLREGWKRLPNWLVPPLSRRLSRHLP
jgi:FemAB-related protein (PEP-CTERM system-associated)